MSEAMENYKVPAVEQREIDGRCTKHGPFTAKQTLFNRKWMGGRCPKCEKDNNSNDVEKLRKLSEAAKLAKIPKRFKSASFNGYQVEDDNSMQRFAYATVKKYADNWKSRLEAGGGLTLFGKCGTGKTHLVCALANHIIQSGGAGVVYRAVYDVVKSVKSTWARDSQMSEAEAINNFVKPDFLIIDEVGVQFGSEAERLILFEILNRRYENVKPTIIVSNLDDEELTKCLGERVIDRLKEGGGARIGFSWGSYRK